MKYNYWDISYIKVTNALYRKSHSIIYLLFNPFRMKTHKSLFDMLSNPIISALGQSSNTLFHNTSRLTWFVKSKSKIKLINQKVHVL